MSKIQHELFSVGVFLAQGKKPAFFCWGEVHFAFGKKPAGFVGDAGMLGLQQKQKEFYENSSVIPIVQRFDHMDM